MDPAIPSCLGAEGPAQPFESDADELRLLGAAAQSEATVRNGCQSTALASCNRSQHIEEGISRIVLGSSIWHMLKI